MVVCNALVFGILIYYSLNYLLSHLTFSKVQNPMQFIFKLIIFGIFMNNALWLCNQIIEINSFITDAIRTIGGKLFNEDICFSNFIILINEKIYLQSDTLNLFSFDGIIKSFTTIGFINLVFTNALRYVMIQVFVIISPFAFLSLASIKTEKFFTRWIQIFLSLLIEQILIAIILILAFSFEKMLNKSIIKLIYVGILYSLMRANTYMNQIFGGITTTINSGLSSIKNLK